MDNSSDHELENAQNDMKRPRHEPKVYSISRKTERLQRLRKTRLCSRDSFQQSKEHNVEAIILDSGGYTVKINYSSESQPKIIPNCIMKAKSERKRLFIGDQIEECRDCSGLFYLLPCERGYITKWDVQKPIWDYIFSKNSFPIGDYPVIMTQPLFNFKSIQDCIDEIFFEEYEVSSMFRLNPTDLASLKYQQEFGTTTCVIVDCGYSFTHIIPYINGKKYWKGIKRLNVGGKLLTNHLKDIISYRQYHVMEETYVINQVKEDTCFVSEDFKMDLKTASLLGKNNHIVKNYVLPDFNNIRRGYIQNPDKIDGFEENCQILRLNNERFTVPEILFHPSDIGMKSIGIAEATFKAILCCPLGQQKQLANHIVLIGGSTKFPGFRDRFFNEIRSMICASWNVQVFQPDEPVNYSWLGGKNLLKTPNFKSKLVTKEQYEELGLSAIQEKFNDWSVAVEDPIQIKSEVKAISYIEHIKKYDVFGKGDEEPTTENSTINDENKDLANTNKETEEVIVSSDLDENADGETRIKTNKMIKKSVRSTMPVVYSVKIVSSGLKPC